MHGAGLRKPEATLAAPPANLPEPTRPALDRPWNVVIAGIGGTGVVTIGAMLGMAAHLDGASVSVLDVLGLAQKGGAVVSHVRFGGPAGSGQALRVPEGRADLLLGCDALVAGEHETLDCLGADTASVVNLHETITGAFTRDPDFSLPMRRLRQTIAARVGDDHLMTLDATGIATALMGDAIATNLFVLGYAWQLGKVPVSRESLEQAIRVNNQAVALNLAAFAWGRAACVDLAAVIEKLPKTNKAHAGTPDLDALIQRFAGELTLYQNAGYAQPYLKLIEAVLAAESRLRPGSTNLTEAVARNFYKLLAYKDEYEVARLYSTAEFRASLAAQFVDGGKIRLHLAPPLLAKRDKRTGHLQKRDFGPWVLSAFALLEKLKFLRGSALDPFGRTEERRIERALPGRYEQSIRTAIAMLDENNLAKAVELASLPAQIRGFGHVKEANLRAVEPVWQSLDAVFAPNSAPKPTQDQYRVAAE